ncbi:hypothetical protein [Endozoicomonas sp. 4G]|nr:hypothetical protein [Endozoicomonas sp. 4G]
MKLFCVDSKQGTAEEFAANLAMASRNLQKEVLRLLDLLAQHQTTAAA